MLGRARDIRTGEGIHDAEILAETGFEVSLEQDKTISAIKATDHETDVAQLIGQRGGSHLRVAIAERLPDLLENNSLLYLLLDDISGTSLVSPWAWSQWREPGKEEGSAFPLLDAQRILERVGICWGLKEGSSGLELDRTKIGLAAADGGELRNPIDPRGWHEFPVLAGVSMRRARRIDIWREPTGANGDVLRIEAAFQDSASKPDGKRAAIHEYIIRASASPATMELLAIEAEPRVLPFPECPGAVANIQRLIGMTASELRESVIEALPREHGCTHLNDALRSMSEVPNMARKLINN